MVVSGSDNASPTESHSQPIALCNGELSDELVALLSDVLADLHIDVRGALPVGATPAIFIVGVAGRELKRVLTAARAAAGFLPIVAVLPIQDRRLASAALRSGANACYALGTPLSNLRVLVAQLLIAHWTRSRRASAHLGGQQ
ncbi:MAG: hypothetical protein ACT4TC_11520 [Myxococcaceae bacterium]